MPVRTEVMIDKLLDNGTVYSLHHIYDYFNFNYYVDNDETVFEVRILLMVFGKKHFFFFFFFSLQRSLNDH